MRKTWSGSPLYTDGCGSVPNFKDGFHICDRHPLEKKHYNGRGLAMRIGRIKS